MKIKTAFILAAALFTISFGAQTYQILRVSPDTLVPGENTLTIFLNKVIIGYDSIVVSVSDQAGPNGYWYEDNNPSWTDSTLTACIIVPANTSSRDIHLSINLADPFTSVFDVTILDMTGRSIGVYPSFANGDKIDLSHLDGGMYLVRIKSNNFDQKRWIIKD